MLNLIKNVNFDEKIEKEWKFCRFFNENVRHKCKSGYIFFVKARNLTIIEIFYSFGSTLSWGNRRKLSNTSCM